MVKNLSMRQWGFHAVVMSVWAWGSMAGGQTPSAPQQPAARQAGTYSLQVNAQIVVLDVVVNDKNGGTVKGLTRDDFTVYEDKAPQPIRSFETTTEVEKPEASTGVAVNSTQELDAKAPDAPVSIIVL